MGKGIWLTVLLLSCSVIGLAHFKQDDQAKAFVGTWAGAWQGGSDGEVSFTLTADATGKLKGEASPKPAGGDSYTVPFVSIVQAGNKLTMKLSTPGDEAEVTIDGTVEGHTFKGTYSVKIKADGSEVDRGTLTATKKV